MSENENSVASEHASGDTEPKFSAEFTPEPPPRPPDVELIEDGFGILSKSRRSSKAIRNSSKVFQRTSIQPELLEEASVVVGTPCSSSADMNIVRRYTWKTLNRMIVQVITYGATFTSIRVPDRKGVPDDVIAGFDDLEGYLQVSNPYFGASIGRCANVIRDGAMALKPSGRLYTLSTNKGENHYHGGFVGFDKVNWRSHKDGTKVIMSHLSERYNEGYPGALLTQITIDVTLDNTIMLDIKCTTSEPTVVNITYQPYFNLAGHYAGPEELNKHIFTINADKYTPVDDNLNIVGQKKVVGGTGLDFRVPRILSTMLPHIPLGGYDLNYCVTRGTDQELTFVSRVLHPTTGRVLEVYSNQPGVQFYTGNLLPDPDRIIEGMDQEGDEESGGEEGVREEGVEDEGKGDDVVADGVEEAGEEEEQTGFIGVGYVPLIGKQGTHYVKHGLFCLMPQKYPDAVNQRIFPSPILNPGETYHHQLRYKFGLLLGNFI